MKINKDTNNKKPVIFNLDDENRRLSFKETAF